CLEKARKAFSEHNIAGEILVADNGSTDLSRTIAQSEGARDVTVQEPGYGSALMGGIAAANGRFIVIGDADDSYEFPELPKIAEVPITLHPDGRTSHAPHLKTFRDGWRTFRYFLMCSPRWLFLIPGGAFIAFGLLGYLVAMPGLRIGA